MTATNTRATRPPLVPGTNAGCVTVSEPCTGCTGNLMVMRRAVLQHVRGVVRGATARARLLARLVEWRRATQPASCVHVSRTCTPPRTPVGSTRRAWSMPDCHLLLRTRTRELTLHPAHARVVRSPWGEVGRVYLIRYERLVRGASTRHDALAPISPLSASRFCTFLQPSPISPAWFSRRSSARR